MKSFGFSGLGAAALPTYKTAAEVLEKKTGSGLKLAGWTVARTILIAPPVMLAGVPAKKAFLGAAFASLLISTFTLLRIFNAGPMTKVPMTPLGRSRARRSARTR